MTLIEQLRTVAGRYAEARRLSEARVSTIVFGDGKVLKSLAEGADITTRRLERGLQWFSANWPEGASWPEDVDRPAVRISKQVGISQTVAP